MLQNASIMKKVWFSYKAALQKTKILIIQLNSFNFLKSVQLLFL